METKPNKKEETAFQVFLRIKFEMGVGKQLIFDYRMNSLILLFILAGALGLIIPSIILLPTANYYQFHIIFLFWFFVGLIGLATLISLLISLFRYELALSKYLKKRVNYGN